MDFRKDLALRKFQEYLRIKSVHPNPDYASAVEFLVDYGSELQLDVKCVELFPDRKVVIMSLPGENTSLPSIMLNSHMDVVPVYPENWTRDPWSADITDTGDIYGRGTQDMKSVGIQYLEALRILKSRGDLFKRTIHITFVPDEEIGGGHGMRAFIDTKEFQALNVGLALDEGLANPDNKYSLFYGERSTFWVRVKCEGNPGHGSRFIQNTAAEKLQKVMKSFLDFRKSEEERLDNSSCLFLGDVTTINMTMVEGGVQPNVIPKEFCATFDIRIPITVDLAIFEKKIAGWCRDAGEGVSYDFLIRSKEHFATQADDASPWWKTMTSVLRKRGVEVVKEVFSAGTDGTYLRERGYPVIGFSPMRDTPIRLHDNDEFLNKDIFLEGIEVYCDIITGLANLDFSP